MEETCGFVKFHRKILNWEWYQDTNTFRLFFHLIAKAQWKNSRYQGHEVPRGSLVIGRKALALELGMSEQSVRTALEHLKSTGEITLKSTNKFTIATIVKYCDFQDVPTNEQPTTNQQLTNNQPTTNQQLTTSKERKNIRKKEGKNNKQIVFPENLNTDSFRSHWERWVKYRKERRNPLVESTIESQLVFLSKYSEEVAIWIIEKSINKGWQGLFEPKSDELAAMAAKKEKGKGDGIFDILNNFNPEKDDIWQ